MRLVVHTWGVSKLRAVRRKLEDWMAQGLGAAVSLTFRIWRLALWLKSLMLICAVTVFASLFSYLDIFSPKAGIIIGVVTVQTAFAAYLVAVSREEHVKKLRPVAERILENASPSDTDITNLLDNTSRVTLELPRRLSLYVLTIDLLVSPFTLVRGPFVQVWICTMSFPCTAFLLVATLLLHVDIFEPWIGKQVKRLQDYLHRHGLEAWLGLLLLLLLLSAPNIIATLKANEPPTHHE